MGGDPFDIFNSIFKEFNQGGQGQGGFNFGNFQQQFRNQPKVNYYLVSAFLGRVITSTGRQVHKMV